MFGTPNYMGYGGGYVPSYYPQAVPAQMSQMPGQMPSYQGQQPPMNQYGQMTANQQPSPYQQTQQPQATGANVIWVTDDRQVSEYPVVANSSAVLWNVNSPVVYLKQADASGRPSTKVFDLVERPEGQKTAAQAAQNQGEEYAPKKEFDSLTSRVDALATSIEALSTRVDSIATSAAARRTQKAKEPVKEVDE